MADTIHKKQLKKDYPHFDHFYLAGSASYAEGYDRIFGKKEGKNGKEGNKLQKQKGVQKVAGLRSHSQGVQRKNSRKNPRKIS